MEGRLRKRLICGKVFPLQTWEAIASAGLKFRSLTLEVLVQPCVPLLKREAGKPEGVYAEQSGGESQGKDEGTRD